MTRLSPTMKQAWERFDVLSEKALSQITKVRPYEDVNKLVLSEYAFNSRQLLPIMTMVLLRLASYVFSSSLMNSLKGLLSLSNECIDGASEVT